MKTSRAARRYAMALMAVAEEQKMVDRIAADLELIDATLRGSRELRLLVESPVVAPAKKKGALRAVFGERVTAVTITFLDLLVSKERERILPDIAADFGRLRDEKEGIVSVEVTSAVQLGLPQEQKLREKLEQFTGKKIRIRVTLDTALKGGLRVQIGDTVLDASIRRQLEMLRAKFLEGGTALN